MSVVRNGAAMTPAERADIVAWIAAPGSIAALARFLAARDLSQFDMYVPLKSVGKDEMIEQSLSPVEECLRDIMEDRESRGLVFTRQLLELAVGDNFKASGDYWRGDFAGLWNRYCVGLKTSGRSPRRIKAGGTYKKVFCFRSELAQAAALPEATLLRETKKWPQCYTAGLGLGSLDGFTVVPGHHEKDE